MSELSNLARKNLNDKETNPISDEKKFK